MTKTRGLCIALAAGVAMVTPRADGWAAPRTPSSAPAKRTTAAPRYTYRRHHDPNGTGKFYMGREIARVMGHEAVDWLERPQREQEEAPARLIEALQLRRGEVVADIGAGSGYITRRLARAVGPEGRVKAVDIQPEMLASLKRKLRAEGIDNVDPVLGKVADPRLDEKAVDAVLMVDVYHELAFPYELMQAVVRSLKPGGRVVLVEYRMEDANVPIKLVHKMTAEQAIAEMSAVGLRLQRRDERLPWQHVLVFELPSAASHPATRVAD